MVDNDFWWGGDESLRKGMPIAVDLALIQERV